jgi:signal transduction histidine kinase
VRFRHLRVIDAVVPALVGAVVIVGLALQGGASDRPLPVALALGAAAILWARKRAPGWTLAISGGLVVGLFHVDGSAGTVAVLAPAVALYSLAISRGRWQRLLAGLAAVAAVIVAEALHAGRPTLLQSLGHVLLVAIPLLAADVIRTHRSYVLVLHERLELAERTREQEAARRAEYERLRIARELHDLVAHTLTSINVQAAAAAESAAPGDARSALERIEEASHDAIGELRAILGVLRDPEQPDAPRAPSPGVENIEALVQRSCDAGLRATLSIGGERPQRLSEAVSLAAYRIVQESLTNAQRHAPGAAVRVRVGFQVNGLAVDVESGAGGAPSGNGTRPGVGIDGMRERAAAIGGTLQAGPTPTGYAVRAELPYEPAR